MNYYGTRLATCSSDHLVKIFEIKANGQSLPIAELTGHDGPVFIYFIIKRDFSLKL